MGIATLTGIFSLKVLKNVFGEHEIVVDLPTEHILTDDFNHSTRNNAAYFPHALTSILNCCCDCDLISILN